MPAKGIEQVQRKVSALQKAFRRQVPVKMQAAAVRVFRANFKAQGFVDRGVKPWRPRTAYKVKHLGRKQDRLILVDKALLLNSIRANGQASWNNISVQAGGPHVPYAKIHNEGGTIRGTFNVRAHTRRTRSGDKAKVKAHKRTVNTTMPQRKYMGDSFELRTAMRKEIVTAIIKTLATK